MEALAYDRDYNYCIFSHNDMPRIIERPTNKHILYQSVIVSIDERGNLDTNGMIDTELTIKKFKDFILLSNNLICLCEEYVLVISEQWNYRIYYISGITDVIAFKKTDGCMFFIKQNKIFRHIPTINYTREVFEMYTPSNAIYYCESIHAIHVININKKTIINIDCNTLKRKIDVVRIKKVINYHTIFYMYLWALIVVCPNNKIAVINIISEEIDNIESNDLSICVTYKNGITLLYQNSNNINIGIAFNGYLDAPKQLKSARKI